MALLFTSSLHLLKNVSNFEVIKDRYGTRSDQLPSLADDLLASRCCESPEICGTKREKLWSRAAKKYMRANDWKG